MQKRNDWPKNRKNIFFIGRGEYEKGADILLEIIQIAHEKQKNWHFHIFWEGKFFQKISHFDDNFVSFYGKISQESLYKKLSEADYVFMPSRFLETFGLVALEAISFGVPVIGFRKGGLNDFILPEHEITPKNYREKFFEIVEKGDKNLPDIQKFSYENWQKNLEKLTKNYQKILLVHDYFEKIWGAEIYVHHLKNELEKIGKTVQIFAYRGKITSFDRKKLFLFSIFSKKNKKLLSEMIWHFSPDLVWSHSVLRYVGFSGMEAISKKKIPHYMTHHDVGMFAPRPSKIENEEQIPRGMTLGKWLHKAKNFSDHINATIKYIIASRIFRKISPETLHIFPSAWMENIAKSYHISHYTIFPHTIWKNHKK